MDDIIQIDVLNNSKNIGCIALLAAIVDQAIRDYLASKNPKNKNNPIVAELGKDAKEWIFNSTNEFMSFNSICSILNWSPEWIKKELQNMIRHKQYYKKGRRRKQIFESDKLQ